MNLDNEQDLSEEQLQAIAGGNDPYKRKRETYDNKIAEAWEADLRALKVRKQAGTYSEKDVGTAKQLMKSALGEIAHADTLRKEAAAIGRIRVK
jgi:hypothetical protein